MGVVEEDRGSKQRLTDEQLEEEEGGERNREENRGITLGVPRCSGQGGKRVWGGLAAATMTRRSISSWYRSPERHRRSTATRHGTEKGKRLQTYRVIFDNPLYIMCCFSVTVNE